MLSFFGTTLPSRRAAALLSRPSAADVEASSVFEGVRGFIPVPGFSLQDGLAARATFFINLDSRMGNRRLVSQAASLSLSLSVSLYLSISLSLSPHSSRLLRGVGAGLFYHLGTIALGFSASIESESVYSLLHQGWAVWT